LSAIAITGINSRASSKATAPNGRESGKKVIQGLCSRLQFDSGRSLLPHMKEANSGPAALEKQIRYLLGDLCVDWGFCIPPADADRIARSKRLEADEFAAEVLRAEGMFSEYETKWFPRIKQRFIERFGSSVSVEDF